VAGRAARGLALAAAAVALAGCQSPGTPAPASEAAKLDVATNRISVACGYAEELGAFGGGRPAGLDWIQSIAVSGARKLASVYAHDQSDIYQGESIGAIVGDSVSLLGGCRLYEAERLLKRALATRH
jgi:hypothetical protein